MIIDIKISNDILLNMVQQHIESIIHGAINMAQGAVHQVGLQVTSSSL